MDTQNPNLQNQHEEKAFDYKKLINRVFVNWPFLILSIVIFGIIGVIFYKWSTSNYKISSMMLVEDQKPGASGGGNNELAGLGS